MAKLTEVQKEFIIAELAMFSTPSQVAAAFKEEFGFEITKQQAYDYKPSTTNGRKLGKKLRVLHEAVRKKFIDTTAEIPVANRSYRLKRLQHLLEKAESMGAVTVASSLLEQAAKEVGDVFTNRQKVDANVNVHEDWLARLPPPPAS